MELSAEHEPILISASEDYLTLAEAELEMIPFSNGEAGRHQLAERVVTDLLNSDYIYMVELVEGVPKRREIRRLDRAEAIRASSNPDDWQHYNTDGKPYFALSASDKGRAAFFEIISRPRDSQDETR